MSDEIGKGSRPRVAVAIPARDEADKIGACLGAAGQQTCCPSHFVLLLNNCSDATEQIARSVSLPFPLTLHCVSLPPRDANAGTARRLAMDCATSLAGPAGIVMTTGADAVVPPNWVALNRRALSEGADVVCGRASSIQMTRQPFPTTSMQTML